MRIGVDGLPLLGCGGITNYVRPLVDRLLRRGGADHFVVLRWRSKAPDTVKELAPVRRCRLPDRLCQLWWRNLRRPLPGILDVWSDLDVHLAATPFVPRLRHGKVALVVYDVTPLRLPELFPDHDAFRERMVEALARSHRVIAISNSTARDVEEMLGVPGSRIDVIPPGVGERFRPLPRPSRLATLERLQIEPPYLLHVGSLGAHKNVAGLLEAFTLLATDHPRLTLVLAGSRRWGDDTVARLGASPHHDRIRLLGRVSDADLPALYSAATALAFPSWYEGFGLPVLEAMACGTAVVVSDRGALPEVVGDAAPTVDPGAPEALAEELDRLVRDATTRRQRALAGLHRARSFDWDRSARRLETLLRSLGDVEDAVTVFVPDRETPR